MMINILKMKKNSFMIIYIGNKLNKLFYKPDDLSLTIITIIKLIFKNKVYILEVTDYEIVLIPKTSAGQSVVTVMDDQYLTI